MKIFDLRNKLLIIDRLMAGNRIVRIPVFAQPKFPHNPIQNRYPNKTKPNQVTRRAFN